MPVPPGAFGPGSERPFAQYFEGESSVRVASIEEIVAWLQTCEYVSDVELFRKRDVWQHPSAFEQPQARRLRGLCAMGVAQAGRARHRRRLLRRARRLDRSTGRRLPARLGGLSHRRNGVSPRAGAARTPAQTIRLLVGRDGPVRAALRREPSIRDQRLRGLCGRLAPHRARTATIRLSRYEARTDQGRPRKSKRRSSGNPTRLELIRGPCVAPSRELEFLKFLDTLGQYLRSTRDPRKALAFTLREGRAFFQAAGGCIAVAEAGERDARLLVGMPRDDGWDLEHIGRFIRHTRPPVRSDLVLAPIRRRGAAWGAMAFRRPSPPFDHDDRPAAGEDHGGGLGCRPVDGS